MNVSMVRYTLARLLLLEAGLILVPLLVGLVMGDSPRVLLTLLATSLVLGIIGSLASLKKPKQPKLYAKEGMMIVALCWILWSFFGALPFYLTGQIPSLIDAFFETSSGFTTTGATILTDVTILSPALMFWRSFTHLIGGMGVLVFALAIMDNSQNSHLELMRAEVPGPVFGKLVSRLKDTAQILYLIYLGIFLLFTASLWLAGLPLFDSFIIGMGTAGTGGFAHVNASIAHYDSSLITNLVTGGMLLFGVNFNLYYLLLLRKVKLLIGDEELGTYLLIILISGLLLWFSVGGLFESHSRALEVILFQIATMMSSTGFGLNDTTSWPLLAQLVLLMLMFVGGMAGSTAGGFKVMRVLILAKILRLQTLQHLYPNRILTLHINGRQLDKATQHSILRYFTIYVAFFIGLVFLLSRDNQNLLTVISASASILNNIGPMLGTTDSFAIFSPLSKLVLSFAMIAGRLEIFPVLLLFSRKMWSRY